MSTSICSYRRFPVRFTVIIFVLFMISLPSVHAAKEGRPFWTEKSTFIEGEDLFVVGIATKARTPEEGRHRAFDHGKIELMDFAQLTDIEGRGMFIETQMTFEEINSDGTFTVFRLLRIPLERLMALQERSKSKPDPKGIDSLNNTQTPAATHPTQATFTREGILALQYELRKWEQPEGMEKTLVSLAGESRQALHDYFNADPPNGLAGFIRFLNAAPGPSAQKVPPHAPQYRCRVTGTSDSNDYAVVFVRCSVQLRN
jgi:hypothetical protein